MGETDFFTMFENMGISRVRDYAPQWRDEWQNSAYKWLKLKDDQEFARQDEILRKEDEARRSNEDSQAEQLRIARAAKKSAKIAAIAAIIAIPIAIIAIIISALAWLYPRH